MGNESLKSTGELLKEIPRITRDLLYSWESGRYIVSNGTLKTKEGYNRKGYNPETVVKIKKMFKHYQEGMSPRKASEKADEEIAKIPTLFNYHDRKKKISVGKK